MRRSIEWFERSWIAALVVVTGCATPGTPSTPSVVPLASGEETGPDDEASWVARVESPESRSLPTLHFRLETRGEYSDGCSQTTIFGTRHGQAVLQIEPDGRVIGGLQIVSSESVGPGLGGKGGWQQHAWLHTWFYTGQIALDELDDGVLDVTLEPAVGDACHELPAGWQPYEPWLNEPPGCSEATEPLVLSCVQQRDRLPGPSAASGRTLVPTSEVDVIACEIEGSPHADLIGPGGKLFFSEAPGLELANAREENYVLGSLDGPLSADGVLTFDPDAAP